MLDAFHDIRLPDDIAFGSTGGPVFSTDVVVLASGHERRNADWAEARARYDIAMGVRGMDQLSRLIAFFRARRGRACGFRFKDWTDWTSATGNAAPTALDQPLGTGTGSQTTFALIKRYETPPLHVDRRIVKPVAGSVRVAIDGVEAEAGAFSADTTTGMVSFPAPPLAGAVLTAGFAFDVPVRFDTDHLPATIEDYGIGAVRSVPLVEIRL
ncbi:glycoside hydrolase family 24 [Tistrella bauzanensis]|uniref:Glycoside hydrolase family 24 n=1 Tax=Tistrella bauzanensis TaxID=657419 RepID=A0ABQ1ISJ6_9PROT|nr:DUF2460 domain-containing protein [Tistrella bauzanensis]GGB51492.1 glycoside hydrolase family 24 [Tistrella bauzanensis]